MANLLIVDTCGATGSIAVARISDDDANILAERMLPGRETQERLMTALADVLTEAALLPADLDALAVVTGPGSFTGVRIGLAAVKGLAEALQLPVIALSRLAILAAQSAEAEAEAWIDAGRGEVFAGLYSNGTMLDEVLLPGAEAAARAEAAAATVVAMEESTAALLPSSRRVQPVGTREALPLAAASFRAGHFADIALLDANYLRKPDAQRALEARTAAA